MKKSIINQKVAQLPQEPGVYFFMDKNGKIIYIGKATNLKSRVQSYFPARNASRSDVGGRGINVTNRPIELMIEKVADIDFQKTDSVLEALILESNLIKKHQPKYNVDLKDDKSFSYFAVTKEGFPRVLILRKTDLQNSQTSKRSPRWSLGEAGQNVKTLNLKFEIYGPYVSKKSMEIALKIMRKIFPFHSNKQETEKGCLDYQIGLCPGPYAGAISKEDYAKNIRGIRMILEGKKKNLVKRLEIEMREAARKNEFEKAAELRNKIFALEHIRDIALITKDTRDEKVIEKNFSQISNLKSQIRIEAYDISNISGTNAVGSMVVFENGEPNKSQYRKFKIKTVAGSDDVGMMKEVLLRRFQHTFTRSDKVGAPSLWKGEGNLKKTFWPMPDLVLLDGGQGHANAIGKLVTQLGLSVLVVAVAKGLTRKNLNFQFPISNQIPMSQFPKKILEILYNKSLIKSIMDEAHRFAITYHRRLRRRNALK